MLLYPENWYLAQHSFMQFTYFWKIQHCTEIF